MSEPNRVTVHDVARHAGLSTASVSRVLTGARRVRPDIAERVRAAAAELGYLPDQVGRALRRRVTETVGVVVADITNPFFPSLVQAVEGAIREAGYGLLLADAQNNVEMERRAISMLLARNIDALLISPCHRVKSRPALEEAARLVRVIQIDRTASSAAHYVGIDHSRAIRDVLAHLAGTGRRRPVFIGSDPSVSTSWQRQRAFVRHAPAIDPEAADRVLAGEFSVEWGRRAAADAVRRWPTIDSFVCADDLIALGVLQELARLGRVIPDDVAIAGFDDTLLASVSEPALTTIRQPLSEMAAIAIAIAIGSTEDVDAVISHRVRARLVVRASTAPSGSVPG